MRTDAQVTGGFFSYHSPKIEIRKSSKEGIGLFAISSFAKDELILTTGGRILTLQELESYEKPGHPFQIEKDLELTPIDSSNLDGIFVVNHSCMPNAGIRGQLTLVALRPISAGEEICYDYAMTDSDPEGKETIRMHCHCRTPECRSLITDLDWRDKKLQLKYRGYFSHYLQGRIDLLSTV